MKVAKTTAIITPSYGADFERCALLCDSIDMHVTGVADHYILVDESDLARFSALAGPNRHIINEKDILPKWLHSVRGGFGRSARKIWFSTRTWPMRGWHVQQLRRIAIAAHIDHDGLLYCDSDMLFIRQFDCDTLWRGDELRLYRIKDGVMEHMKQHVEWLGVARRLNGLTGSKLPHDDYINNLVSWRRDQVLAMCSHIENTTGRDWLSSIGRNRSFSECLIYGVYVDDVCQTNPSSSAHWHADFGLCRTYWDGGSLDRATLQQFVEQMDDRQCAIGIQSFTNTDIKMLRELL